MSKNYAQTAQQMIAENPQLAHPENMLALILEVQDGKAPAKAAKAPKPAKPAKAGK